MLRLQHVDPEFRTHVGPDCLAALPRELERAGARRAVLVCGASVARHPLALPRVRDALGARCVGVFDRVREHSPVPVVVEAARLLGELDADAVVAVGGGSAVVTARAAAILLAERRDVRELCTRRTADGRLASPRLDAPKLPQWVVATVPTTAYAKAGSAVRDPGSGERLAMFDPKTRARALFVHPDLALSAPASLARSASLNAFATAVEGLQSKVDDPLAEGALRHALAMFAESLPALVERPDDADVRARLMLAALLCGLGSDHMGGGVGAVLAHALGPACGVANGVAQATVLPHTLRFNAPATVGRSARIAHALGVPAPGAGAQADEAAIAAVERLLGALGVPRRLRELGIARDALAPMVPHLMDDWFLGRNPRPVAEADLRALLDAAW